MELYAQGQRDFGENYVQDLVEKNGELPKDIRWHFIGHLQSNKVKQLAPFVHLIHGVDSLKLLREIDRQGAKSGHVLNCLLQVHISNEETKFGFDEKELEEVLHAIKQEKFEHAMVKGLMGMASFSDDLEKIRSEFHRLSLLYITAQKNHPAFDTLSMGMSSDYTIALEEGSNMVRIGSLLFGQR